MNILYLVKIFQYSIILIAHIQQNSYTTNYYTAIDWLFTNLKEEYIFTKIYEVVYNHHKSIYLEIINTTQNNDSYVENIIMSEINKYDSTNAIQINAEKKMS